jgi:hypothetical protein
MPKKYTQYKYRLKQATKQIQKVHDKASTLQMGNLLKTKSTFCLAAQSKLASFDLKGLLLKMQ